MATFRPEEENSVYIGHGTELTGAIRARDSIVIDGSVEGEIICSHLVVGTAGVVKGVVSVSTADVAGHLSAEIVAKSLLVVRATGRIEGKWNCGVIEVARGAILNGTVDVIDSGSQRRVTDNRVMEPAQGEAEFVDMTEVDAPVAALVAPTPARGTRRIGALTLRSPRRTAV